MSLFARALDAVAMRIAKSLGDGTQWWGPASQPGFGIARGGLSGAKADAAIRGHVFTAVNIVASRVARADVQLWAINERRQGEEVQLWGQPFHATMRSPNPIYRGREEIYRTVVSLIAHGDAYWFKVLDPILGIPVGYWLLPARLVRVNVAPRDLADGGRIFYSFHPNGIGNPQGVEVIPASLIVHHRMPNEAAELVGFSRIKAAAASIEVQEKLDAFWPRFFAKGTILDHVITTKIPNTTDALDLLNRLTARVRAFHQGLGRSGEPLILPEGSDAKPVQGTIVEMQLLELGVVSRDDAMAIIGVPKVMAGYTDNVQRANAQAMEYVLGINTVDPIGGWIADGITSSLLPDYEAAPGIRLECRFAGLVPRDEEADLARVRALKEGRIITTDEAREEWGYGPTAGGDVILVESSLIPLTDAAQGWDAQPAAPAADSQAAIPSAPTKAVPAPRAASANGRPTESPEQRVAVWRAAAPGLATNERNLRRGSRRAFERQWKRIGPKILAVASKYQGKCVGWSPGKVRTLLAHEPPWIRRDEDPPANDGSGYDRGEINHDVRQVFDDDVDPVANDLRPFVTDALERGGKAGASQVGLKWDISRPEAQRFLKRYVPTLAADISRTSAARIGRAIAAGVEAGDSLEALAQRVTGAYEDMSRQRSFLIARTEGTTAYNEGTILAWTDKELGGLVTGKEWIASDDDRTRDEHAARDGVTVGIDSEWAPGVSCPGAATAPASERCNCRCVMRPIFGTRD